MLALAWKSSEGERTKDEKLRERRELGLRKKERKRLMERRK